MEKQKCLLGFAALFLSILSTDSSKTCADFHFPTISGSSLTVVDPINLTIPFTIDHHSCTPAENFSLRVTRVDDKGDAEAQCSLRHRNGICLNPAGLSKCTCPFGGEPYQLTHSFDSTDSLPTEWVWSTDDNKTEERRLRFEVCSSHISLAEPRHIHPGTLYLQANVQTHFKTFPQCALRRLGDRRACSVTNIRDSDSVLTVRLDNVRKQDEGQWTLTLTYEEWLGCLDIDLPFPDNAAEPTSTSDSPDFGSTTLSPETNFTEIQEKPNSNPQTWVMAFAAAVAVAVVAVVIAVCRECRRNSGRNAAHAAEELAMRGRENVAHEEHGSRQSAHYYMEVPDSPPPSDEGSVAEEPAPLPCHGPGNPPEDYLNPEPSREETEEEGTEWKTVPFYENTQISNVEPRVLRELSRGEAHASNSNSCKEVMEVMEYVDSLDGGNSASVDVPQTENSGVESEEGYVPYAPQLYENTMP